MDSDSVLVVIYVDKVQLWDGFILRYDGVFSLTEPTKTMVDQGNYSSNDMLNPKSLIYKDQDGFDQLKILTICRKMNGHTLSYFVKLLKLLRLYRKLVIQNMKREAKCWRRSPYHSPLLMLSIHLVDVDQQIIDKIWNKYISYSVAEHCELDHAMSWLSTLGGAFSALGDYYTRCAERAGQISLQQFRLALRLGDPNTVARCRLFSALSLMQTGHLKAARRIIWNQYHAVKSGGDGLAPDTRLVRMCLGCWAKLRYEYQQRRHRKLNPKALHWMDK